ncbi:Os07g0694350 [Oryza sativa Japonica Group]|nr:Os07g0694350 [Oryza sativa Japonica Group]
MSLGAASSVLGQEDGTRGEVWREKERGRDDYSLAHQPPHCFLPTPPSLLPPPQPLPGREASEGGEAQREEAATRGQPRRCLT